MSRHALTYSVADQSFEVSKSLGILNVSAGLLKHLATHPEIGPIDVLANQSWSDRLADIPLETVRHFDYAVAGRASRAGSAAGTDYVFPTTTLPRYERALRRAAASMRAPRTWVTPRVARHSGPSHDMLHGL